MRAHIATLSLLVAIAAAIGPATFAATPAAASSNHTNVAAAGDPDQITWSVKPLDSSSGGRTTFDYAVGPGTAIKDWVVIANSGKVAADFKVYATDAINDRESGKLSLLPADRVPSDLGSWVTTNLSEVHLEAGTQATVPFTVAIPSDASPGDHTAGIIASSVTTGSQKGQQVVVDQRVGARMNLRIAGAIVPKVAAAGFVTGFSPSLNPFAPGSMAIDYSVTNRGNIRLDVLQRIDVAGPFGIHLGTVTLPAVENLLPGQAAHITRKLDGVGALVLAWSNLKLVPGPVGSAAAPRNDPNAVAQPSTSAEVAVAPTSEEQFIPVSATSLSIAVTWSLLALVVLLLVIVALIARYIRTTRAQFYAAVDQAAVDGRESALRDARTTETVSSR